MHRVPFLMDETRQFIDEIVKAPDDPGGYLVFADWLQERGDSWGELITLQAELERRVGNDEIAAAAHNLLKKEKKRFIGDFLDDTKIALEWRNGFLRGFRIIADYNTDTVSVLHALFALPTAALLREVVVYTRDPPAKNLMAKLDIPPLASVEFPRQYEDFKEALRAGDDVRWLSLSQQRIPGKIAQLKNIEWLEINSNNIRELPAEVGKLERLRRLDVDFCYQLRTIADEVFAVENLTYVSMYDCPALGPGVNMGSVNNLLRGFVRAKTPSHRRMVELNLLAGRDDRAIALAGDTDLRAALDNNVTKVREAAVRCLTRELPNPLAKAPLAAGDSVAVLGSINLDKKVLKQRLADMGIKMTTKVTKNTTHALLGKRPRGKQMELGELPLLVEEHVKSLITEGASADGDAPDTAQLVAWLTSADEAEAAKAMAAMQSLGRVPREVVEELLVVCQEIDFKKTRKEAKKLFAAHVDSVVQKAVAKHLKTSLLLDGLGETKRASRLAKLGKDCGDALDSIKLAQVLYARSNVAAKYLFKKGPPEIIRATLQRMRSGTVFTAETLELPSMPKEFAEHTDLTKVGIANNHFHKFPPMLLEMPKLDELDLASNYLSSLPAEIANLKSLRVLDLSSNRFTSFPTELLAMPALEELDLASESYGSTKIEALHKDIGKLSGLRKLNFGNNVIIAFPKSFFALSNLEELELWSTNLPAQIPDGFAKLTSLKHVAINYSNWSTAPLVEALKRLVPNCKIDT